MENDLANDFRELAARFRRITGPDPGQANREIDSASAWGARLIQRASEAGIVDLSAVENHAALWPPDERNPTEVTLLHLSTSWFVLASILPRWYGRRLPADWMGSTFAETGPGVFVAAVSSTDWRRRAEGSAVVADLLAKVCDVPSGQPDNKTDNGKKTKKILPDDPDVMKLVKKIKSELPKGGTKRDIALDFTGGDEKRADSLLRQLQPSRYGHLLE